MSAAAIFVWHFKGEGDQLKKGYKDNIVIIFFVSSLPHILSYKTDLTPL